MLALFIKESPFTNAVLGVRFEGTVCEICVIDNSQHIFAIYEVNELSISLGASIGIANFSTDAITASTYVN